LLINVEEKTMKCDKYGAEVTKPMDACCECGAPMAGKVNVKKRHAVKRAASKKTSRQMAARTSVKGGRNGTRLVAR
jgi:hypothetical protein